MQSATTNANGGYFTVRSITHAGHPWTFAEAHNVLLLVFGLTEHTGRLILIRQFRPPVDAMVLSAPMGCYPAADIGLLTSLAASEAKAETGHCVKRIEHLFDFARSPGMTTERAICFGACFAEEAGPQQLHDDELISVEYVSPESIATFVETASASGIILDSSTLIVGQWLHERLTSIRESHNAS